MPRKKKSTQPLQGEQLALLAIEPQSDDVTAITPGARVRSLTGEFEYEKSVYWADERCVWIASNHSDTTMVPVERATVEVVADCGHINPDYIAEARIAQLKVGQVVIAFHQPNRYWVLCEIAGDQGVVWNDVEFAVIPLLELSPSPIEGGAIAHAYGQSWVTKLVQGLGEDAVRAMLPAVEPSPKKSAKRSKKASSMSPPSAGDHQRLLTVQSGGRTWQTVLSFDEAHLKKADALCDRILTSLRIGDIPPEQFWAALALRIAQDQGKEVT